MLFIIVISKKFIKKKKIIIIIIIILIICLEILVNVNALTLKVLVSVEHVIL